jgi:hypothetical protein
MTTRFFVGRVFRIALAGSIWSILQVDGRRRIGLLSELCECLTLFDEHPIAFGLLFPPQLPAGRPAIDLIGKSPLPPPGGSETFWRAVSVEVMIRLKAPFARLQQAQPRTNSAEMTLSRPGLGNKLGVDQREP